MDIISISAKIESKIAEMEKIRGSIRERIETSAKATANYDKVLAITMIKLGAGEIQQIEQNDGTPIETGRVIASNLDKIAKGVCWKERLDMDTADGLLKSAIKNLDSVAAELNGYQSIYRHLENK